MGRKEEKYAPFFGQLSSQTHLWQYPLSSSGHKDDHVGSGVSAACVMVIALAGWKGEEGNAPGR